MTQPQENLTYIGKGLFSTAYLKEDQKTVLVKSCCPIKEAIALGFFPESKLFPRIKRIDYDEYSTYELPYYSKSGYLKNVTYEPHRKLYKELRNLFEDIRIQPYDYGLLRNKLYEHISSKHFRTIMIDALDGCTNYGSDIGFEFTPRNLKVDSKGRLVLLDCFFMKGLARDLKSRR